MIRSVKSILPQETLRMVYFSYIQSIITYSIIFSGNSPPSIKYSELKKIIRIITNSAIRNCCRSLFKEMKSLPLCSKYKYTVSLYTVSNKHLYKRNMEIQHFNARYNTNLHPTTSNLSEFQKGAYCSGIKIFQSPPSKLKKFVE